MKNSRAWSRVGLNMAALRAREARVGQNGILRRACARRLVRVTNGLKVRVPGVRFRPRLRSSFSAFKENGQIARPVQHALDTDDAIQYAEKHAVAAEWRLP